MIPEVNKELPYADLIKDWPDTDKEWLEKHVAEHFRPIAAKYGRLCFNLVIQVGIATGACALLVHHSQHMGSRVGAEIRGAAQTLANLLNDMVGYAANSKNITGEQLGACKKEIELMGTLSMLTPQVQGSKLILPS